MINLKLVIPKFKEAHSMVTNLIMWSPSPKNKKQTLIYMSLTMANWSPSYVTSVHRKQCGDWSCMNASKLNKDYSAILQLACVILSKSLCRYLWKKCFVPGRGPYYCCCDTEWTVLRKHHNLRALKLCLSDTFCVVVMATTLVASGTSMHILKEPTCQSTLRRRGCDQLGHSLH